MGIFRKLNEKKILDALLIVLFCIISIIMVFHHEPWRDEAQSWLIARDSPNISALANELHYEGLPGLWIYPLYFLNKINAPYISFLFFNFLIILFSVIIFIKYAPFPKIAKGLFIFGYFMIYEYNIIARHYSLTILFLFAIAAFYKNRLKNPVVYGALLILLGTANIHSFVFATLLLLFYLYELMINKQIFQKKFYMFYLVVIIGFALIFLSLTPAKDISLTLSKINFSMDSEHIGRIPGSFLGAFFPLSQPKIEFWNSKLIYMFSKYTAVIGFLLFLISLLFFVKKIRIMIYYLIFTSGLLGIAFFKLTGGYRHNGLIYISFIFFLWISKEYEPDKQRKLLEKIPNFILKEKNLNIIFMMLLVIQLISSAIPLYYDYNYDFSSGKSAANFLIANNLYQNRTLIATYPAFTSTAIIPYLPDHAKFYFLETQDYGSYIVWNKEYDSNSNLSNREILNRIDNAVIKENPKKVIFITGSIISDLDFQNRLKLIKTLNQSVTENIYIYQMKDKTAKS